MTTITKERLLTIKQWRETYGPGSNVVLPAEEAEELARIALASLEQNVLSGNSPLILGEVLSAIREVARIRADFDDFDGDRRGIGDCLDEAEQELIVTINKHASQLAAKPPQEEKSGNADCTATSGKTDNPQASGKQVEELTMLVKRLASSLKSVNKSSKLPDKAMDYLLRNGLVSVEGRGR